MSGTQLHFLPSRALGATIGIKVGPIWSHFGRPMLSHRHPRNLKSPKCSVTSGCRFFTYATCSVAWFASFIVMADARSMTEIRGGTSSVIRIRLTDSREEQRVVQVCHLQRMGVKNAYPSSESASKMRTLMEKAEARARRGAKMQTLKQKVRQKRVPLTRKCVKNAYP